MSTRRVSKRGDVAPFLAMDVLREALEREGDGADILHLEIGQPGFPTPRKVLEAARTALDSAYLGYTDGIGIAPLRERISQYYADNHGITVSPERILVTTGSSGGFTLAFLALFEAGQKVALSLPAYPAYRNILTGFDLDVMWLESEPGDNGVPSVAAIEKAAADGASGLLIASPGNPTGSVIPPEQLKAIVEVAKRLGLWLISDEIYHGLTFSDVEADCALRHDDDAVIINSFSKYFAMTGWRIGWMIVPEGLVRRFEQLAQNLFICAPAISQHAALAAFEATDELDLYRETYAANRRLLLDALPEMGITRFYRPDGAFYLYADIGDFTNDSIDYCQRLLREDGIAATPGLDFDPVSGNRYMRMSYAGQNQTIEKAIARLRKRFLDRA